MSEDTAEHEAARRIKVNTDRRTGRSIQEWVQIIMLLANFGGLVWGAATISSSVTQLQLAQSRINTVVDKIVDKQNTQDLAIVTIQTQLQNFQSQLRDLQDRLRNASIR